MIVPVLTHKLYMRMWGREKPYWVGELAKEWAYCISSSVNSWNYNMSLEWWYCSCSGYLHSRYKICKHLCQATNEQNFSFSKIIRNDRPPFLVIPSIVQSSAPISILNNEDLIGDPHDFDSMVHHELPSAHETYQESPGMTLARQRRRIDKFLDDNIHNDHIMLQMTEYYAPILRVIDEHDAFNRRRRFPTTSSLRGSVRYAN